MDRLLVGVSGSVAVLNLPAYLAALRAGVAKEVRVIMTSAAASIMPPSTVALVCDAVFLDQEPTVEKRPGHIELARWSEMFVVLPATANVIGQAANGLGANLLTTTILASQNPVDLLSERSRGHVEQARRTEERRDLAQRRTRGRRTRSRYSLRGRFRGDARKPRDAGAVRSDQGCSENSSSGPSLPLPPTPGSGSRPCQSPRHRESSGLAEFCLWLKHAPLAHPPTALDLAFCPGVSSLLRWGTHSTIPFRAPRLLHAIARTCGGRYGRRWSCERGPG